MAKDNAYVGVVTFYADKELVGTETCTGRKDAKSHAAFLATQYGPIDIWKDGKLLDSVDESYLDNQFG